MKQSKPKQYKAATIKKHIREMNAAVERKYGTKMAARRA